MKIIRWILKVIISIAATLYVMHLATIHDLSQAWSITIGCVLWAGYAGIDSIFDKLWPAG